MQCGILFIGASVYNLLVLVDLFSFVEVEELIIYFAYTEDYLARLIIIALKLPEHICITSLECVEMAVVSLRESCKSVYVSANFDQ